MATIKSHTDFEQSRKLAEILPLSSADMHYDSGDECEICFGRGMYEEIANWICEGTPRPADIPCWSLAALLSVIPEEVPENYYVPSLQKVIGKYSISYADDELLCLADNPVDACVYMIEKLHELKML